MQIRDTSQPNLAHIHLVAPLRPSGIIKANEHVLRLIDSTDVSSFGLGKRPAKRTIISNDQISKLLYKWNHNVRIHFFFYQSKF